MTQTLLLETHLKTLRLPVIRQQYQKVSRQAAEHNLSYEAYLLALVEEEARVREEHTLHRRITQARFPALKTLDSFEFSACRIETQMVVQLAHQGEYLHRKENVIFLGEPGVGKTHLAIALGMEACRKGYRVCFFTATGLINALREARDNYALQALERKLARTPLVIVDELGFVPLDTTGAQLLFEFFSSRYERGSCIITTNLAFADWTEVFQDQRLTGALLDRVTHHAHIIQIQGDSYRFRQRLAQQAGTPAETKESQDAPPS